MVSEEYPGSLLVRPLLQSRLSHLDCRVRCASSRQSSKINVGFAGGGAIVVDNNSAGASGFRSRRLAVAGALVGPSQGTRPARKIAGRIPGEAGQRATDGDAVPCRAGIGACAHSGKAAPGNVGKCNVGGIACGRRRNVRGQHSGTNCCRSRPVLKVWRGTRSVGAKCASAGAECARRGP